MRTGASAWVHCAKNYKPIDGRSDTGSLLGVDPIGGLNVDVEGKMKNEVDFVCVPD